jgi:hypothetical protein
MHFRGADFDWSLQNINSPTSKPHFKKDDVVEKSNDTQTGMLLGIPRSARCVQRFDDSLNSAIHITYRISLRSSSMREPRDPLLKVVLTFLYRYKDLIQHSKHGCESKNDIDLKNTRESRLFIYIFAQQSPTRIEFKRLLRSTLCAQVGEMIKMTSVHIPTFSREPATACSSLFQ